MTEKEAIERVEKYIKSFNGNALDCIAIGTVLTLLEKYKKDYISTSKRTNEYKKAIECEKCNCSVCQAHLNNIKLQAELEKKDKQIERYQNMLATNDMLHVLECENKDKIIDLMAEWIEKHTKYYDEDGCYCEIEKDICNKNIECEYCIKQHFERKVENG